MFPFCMGEIMLALMEIAESHFESSLVFHDVFPHSRGSIKSTASNFNPPSEVFLDLKCWLTTLSSENHLNIRPS